MDDDLTDPDEKQKIHDDVVEMERTLKDLKEDTAKEKLRYFVQDLSGLYSDFLIPLVRIH